MNRMTVFTLDASDETWFEFCLGVILTTRSWSVRVNDIVRVHSTHSHNKKNMVV